MVADFEELEILGAAETRVRILNAKEVMTPRDGHKIILLVEDGQVKPLGGHQVLRTSTSLQDLPEGAPGELVAGTFCKRRSARRPSWRIRWVSANATHFRVKVIMLNQKSNLMYQGAPPD